MKKTFKDNTPKEKITISGADDRDWYSWRERPVSEAFINILCAELVEWASNDPKALRISTFVRSKKIARTMIPRWRKMFPQFEEAYLEALAAIGDRREIGACEKKYDPGMIKFSLHRYDPEWDEVNKYHSAMKKDEEGVRQLMNVILGNVPESDLVKIKKATSED